MVEPQVVRRMRLLSERGWGVKAIARGVGVARKTVRRYIRHAVAKGQHRPSRRALDDDGRSRARGRPVGERRGRGADASAPPPGQLHLVVAFGAILDEQLPGGASLPRFLGHRIRSVRFTSIQREITTVLANITAGPGVMRCLTG
jgi:hypothetical protein